MRGLGQATRCETATHSRVDTRIHLRVCRTLLCRPLARTTAHDVAKDISVVRAGSTGLGSDAFS